MSVRLQKRLLLYSLLISTVPLVSLGILSYHSQKNVLTEQIRKTLESASYHAADTANRYMDERLSDLSYLSKNTTMNEDSQDDQLQFLQSYIASNSIYSGYIYATSDREILTGNENMDVDHFLESESYKKGMLGQLYLSQVYKEKGENPSFWISTPIYDQKGKIVAVFAPVFDLYCLWKTIDEQLTTEMEDYAHSTFMINKNGWVVSDQDEDKIMKVNFLTKHNLTVEELERSIKERKLIESSDGSDLYAVEKIKQRKEAEEQWYVVTAVDKRHVFAPLADLLKRYMWLSIILIAGITVSVYYITRLIVKPVEMMAESVQSYTKGRGYTQVESTYSEIHSLNRAFTGMIDAIEQREKELLRTEKLKYVGQMAAGVAHEIRNPITTIRGFFQLLKDRPYEEKTFKTYIDIIIEELNRINSIVNELLDLSKPYRVDFKVYQLNDLLEEIIMLQSAELSKKNITIRKRHNLSGVVYTDRNRLYQVILNVIQNSKEAMPKGGTIWIDTKQKESELILTISDNGIGIPQQCLTKLGTPFYTTKEQGTGLGLTTSMKIMEELRGSLEITSEVGIGTAVYLSIPVHEIFPD